MIWKMRKKSKNKKGVISKNIHLGIPLSFLNFGIPIHSVVHIMTTFSIL